MVSSWTQIACGHFLLFASDRLCWVGVGVIIIFKGRLNCLYGFIKALECRAEIKEFIAKNE